MIDSPDFCMTIWVWSMDDTPPKEVRAIIRAIFLLSAIARFDISKVPLVISIIPDRN